MLQNTLSSANAGIILSVSPKVLWIGFGVLFALVAIISIILVYHWSKYGYKPVKTGAMGTIYFIGTIILLSTIFFALISYISSL